MCAEKGMWRFFIDNAAHPMCHASDEEKEALAEKLIAEIESGRVQPDIKREQRGGKAEEE